MIISMSIKYPGRVAKKLELATLNFFLKLKITNQRKIALRFFEFTRDLDLRKATRIMLAQQAIDNCIQYILEICAIKLLLVNKKIR